MKLKFLLVLCCAILSIFIWGCSNLNTLSSRTPLPTETPTQIPTEAPTPTPTEASTQISCGNNGKTSSQDIQGTEMNLAQIKAGNYSSLLGTWTLVAYTDNRYDGTGVQWHDVLPDGVTATITVSTNKIVFNDSAMVMSGNTLTDADGSHLLEYFNDGSSLDAEMADATATINWAVQFYPKGVANDFEPNNGVKIDNSKNLICIWYSGMQHEMVFAKTD